MFLFLGIAYSGPQLGSQVASYSFMKVSLDAEEKKQMKLKDSSHGELKTVSGRVWGSFLLPFSNLLYIHISIPTSTSLYRQAWITPHYYLLSLPQKPFSSE